MTIPIFAHFAAGSYLIPAAAAVKYRGQLNKPMKIFALFVLYSMLHIASEFILGRLSIHNQFLLNIFRLVFLQSILYLYTVWTEQKILKEIFHFTAMAYLLYWCIDVAFTPFPAEFREGIAVASNIILMIASVVILNAANNHSHRRVTEHSVFWIASGIILYAAGTTAVSLMSNAILAMGIEYFNAFWHINWGFTIITNLFFARAFQCKTF
ncbi:MAG: hypothetical protein ACOYNS_12170 [Bacteroidota bacterium]